MWPTNSIICKTNIAWNWNQKENPSSPATCVSYLYKTWYCLFLIILQNFSQNWGILFLCYLISDMYRFDSSYFDLLMPLCGKNTCRLPKIKTLFCIYRYSPQGREKLPEKKKCTENQLRWISTTDSLHVPRCTHLTSTEAVLWF